MDLKKVPSTRRRGEELEQALLEAAWDELDERGVAAFTIDAVARRAHTSRPVIYRRWSTREELLIAAIRFRMDKDHVAVPDTGSLRGDLIALLSGFHAQRSAVVALVAAELGSFFENGMTMETVREQLIGSRPDSYSTVLERAAARGEIDLGTLPAAVRSLPLDLWRQRTLMTLDPDEDYLRAVVDDVFLPLVEHYSGSTS
ncbi:MAG: TetR/AcrR family transcriptional regulator [Gordonia sp. (in: high G+C Gram-positive bacteria)]|uniref:TetR/AcrR family transcriptional regulator n=1 Tax=Gordonia sp. (in: high G+C Gram-positive bacteria) TaxID=84139 RepID=UPI0039E2BFBA